MTDPLTVELEGRPVGQLTSGADQVIIEFNRDYREDLSATTLSMSMSRTLGRYSGAVPNAWLWGLLPDSQDVLQRWARDYDASVASPVSFLGTDIGLDCAGAVRFYPARQNGGTQRDSGVRWLANEEVEARIQDLTRDGSSWLGSQSVGQFSLAGAQAKTALRWDATQDQWGLPYGNEPSTHILKPAIPGFADQHINEHLCLTAARELGLRAASTEITSFGQQQALVVKRFDRYQDSEGAWLRVHQEDMCQALGVHPDLKYQNEGGPSAGQVAGLIRSATGRPLADREVQRFIDALIFNWIIGGTDAHAKNYGLLHSGPQTRLAPLYDISSVLPYDDSNGHKLKLAMKIGGEYKIKRIDRKAWSRFATEVGVDESGLLARCEQLATAAPAAFDHVIDEYTSHDSASSAPDQLAELIRHAAAERLSSLRHGGTAMAKPQSARYALVLTDPVPFNDLPHSSTLSVRMQLLVQPPGEDQFFYYQFLVARWPERDLRQHSASAAPEFWNRVGATAIRAAQNWLRLGQHARTTNVVDAAVLDMTEYAAELETMSDDISFEQGEVICQWLDDADLIERAEVELRPMGGIAPG